jgi:hypothetical protein
LGPNPCPQQVFTLGLETVPAQSLYTWARNRVQAHALHLGPEPCPQQVFTLEPETVLAVLVGGAASRRSAHSVNQAKPAVGAAKPAVGATKPSRPVGSDAMRIRTVVFQKHDMRTRTVGVNSRLRRECNSIIFVGTVLSPRVKTECGHGFGLKCKDLLWTRLRA